MDLIEAVEEEEGVLHLAFRIILNITRIDFHRYKMTTVQMIVNNLFPDASTPITWSANCTNWIKIDVDNLNLICIDFLSEVKVLIVASDHF